MNDHSKEDLALLGRLARAFTSADGVPADVVIAAEQAGALIRTRRRCSWLNPMPVPDFRGAGETLAFRDRSGSVRVEVSTEFVGCQVRVTGVVEAHGARPTVAVHWSGGNREHSADVEVDEVGRFTAGLVPPGPLCLSVRTGADTAITRWFVP